MSPPKLSIVIPTLNEEKYLPLCLESLKKQTFKDFEIIISDGASTDQTIAVARKYNCQILFLNNSNVCQARAEGVKKARGQIIIGADADTIYPQNYLATIHQEFTKDKQVVAVAGFGKILDAPFWVYPLWKIVFFIIYTFYKLTGYLIHAFAFSLSFKKDVYQKIGGYNTKLDSGGDEVDILTKLRKRGKVIFIPHLSPQTSSRRFRVGFFPFFIKHLLYYYWLNYLLRKYFSFNIIKAKPVR